MSWWQKTCVQNKANRLHKQIYLDSCCRCCCCSWFFLVSHFFDAFWKNVFSFIWSHCLFSNFLLFWRNPFFLFLTVLFLVFFSYVLFDWFKKMSLPYRRTIDCFYAFFQLFSSLVYGCIVGKIVAPQQSEQTMLPVHNKSGHIPFFRQSTIPAVGGKNSVT